MKTYEAIFKNDSDGVFAISLVNDPAMEGTFVALSKQKVEFKTIDEEKRELIGLVLEPNKKVIRTDEQEDYFIVFKEDTIKELSHNFFKSGFQRNSTLEHKDKIEGVTFVESWIVEDPEKDKSANFGFSYPKGSWIATMKVDSDEIWNDYVKTGKVKGFSVDAMIGLKETKLNKNKMDIVKAIKDGFSSVMSEINKKEIKLGSVKSGDQEIMFEGDVLEVGAAVWVQAEDERVPLPVESYPLEDGRTLVVSEEGVVGELKEVAEEELSDDKQMEEITKAIKSIMIKYMGEVDEKIEALSKENKALEEKVTELSKQPAAKKVNATPVQLNATGRILDKIRNN